MQIGSAQVVSAVSAGNADPETGNAVIGATVPIRVASGSAVSNYSRTILGLFQDYSWIIQGAPPEKTAMSLCNAREKPAFESLSENQLCSLTDSE